MRLRQRSAQKLRHWELRSPIQETASKAAGRPFRCPTARSRQRQSEFGYVHRLLRTIGRYRSFGLDCRIEVIGMRIHEHSCRDVFNSRFQARVRAAESWLFEWSLEDIPEGSDGNHFFYFICVEIG